MGYAGLETQNAVGFFFLNSEYITYQWDLKGEGLVQSENKVLARPSQGHSNVHNEERELKRSSSV